MNTPADQPIADNTADERVRRLRERRERIERRRARARRWALRSALGMLVLAVLLAFIGYWLLMTFGGRDFLLSQVVARLPADATLTWDKAEGPVAGPLTLHQLHFDFHGTVFDARKVTIDPDVRPLLGKLLRLDALDIEGATLQLPESDEPFQLPTWPGSLPQLELPLALQADTIRVDGLRVIKAGEPLIDIARLRGGMDARDRRLHVEKVVVDSDHGRFTADGRYAPADNYATNLTLSALFPATAARTRARLGLVARGDLDDMQVAIAGNAPAPLHALLRLRGGDTPRWTFKTDTRELDVGLLTGSVDPSTPLAFDLQADGTGGEARLQGRFSQGELTATLRPSVVRVQDQVLELKPLLLDVYDGHIDVRGRADFTRPENTVFKFAVNARDLVIAGGKADAPGTPPSPAIGAAARLGLAGTTSAWALVGNATLTRDGESARVDIDGRGNAEAMSLKSAHVAMPTGSLDATGNVGWTPGLHWDINATMAGFDPGYFASDWKGALRGTLASTGNTRDDGGLDVHVDAGQLGGTLRGRKLDGNASFNMRGPATGKDRSDYDGEIALTIGGSRIDAEGTLTDSIDVDARLSPLQLADVLPGAAGALRGTLQLRGKRNAPDVIADISGSALKYGDYAAASLQAKGQLPWAGSNGELTVSAQTINAGMALDSLRVNARGAVEDLRMTADARGEIGTLSLAGDARKRGSGQAATWEGTLASLNLAPTKGASWQLQSPARFTMASTAKGNRIHLSDSCFRSTAGGDLCLAADWPAQGVTVRGTGLPLALAEPYLPEAGDGRPWLLRGEIAIDGRLRPSGSAYAGDFRLSSASGGVRTGRRNPDRNTTRVRKDLFEYSNLSIDSQFDARKIHASIASGISGGRLDATVDTGWDAYSALSGNIDIETNELTWVELLSPDVVEPSGQLAGHIRLGGTRAQPDIGGQATLTAFTTELPALGVALEDGNFHLDALPDGTARIAGDAKLGEGRLALDGSLGWRGDGQTPLLLNLRGKDILIADTRDLHIVADPDLAIRYIADQPLKVTGTVTVPSALVNLENLDRGISTSPDVVVLDPVDPESNTGPLAFELDLTMAMGDDVRFKGYGLDGTLGGKLRVLALPGRDMTGDGELQIGGRYKAYGQELRITRGQLQWTHSDIADPFLDIRAERKIETEDITAGIDVTGRASAPQASVWTDPATNQSDALSYLALGRSSSSLSGTEGQQIDAASAALNAGGNYIAGKIGAKIGLDSAGVSDSRALGGSVLGIGKQLSPRLYVGYGVSLLGTGQVITLKYLLDHGFDLELETSTLESRGSVNWRKEK